MYSNRKETSKNIHRKTSRKNKNTRKNQKGGMNKVYPFIDNEIQKIIHNSIDNLFYDNTKDRRSNDYIYYGKLRNLDQHDYNDLVELFTHGIEYRGKKVKPLHNAEYKDPIKDLGMSFNKFNIMDLLSITHSIDVSEFIEKLYNMPEYSMLFKKEYFIHYLRLATNYLSEFPTIEKLIEIYEKKKYPLSDIINQKDINDEQTIFFNLIATKTNENKEKRIITIMKLFIDKGADPYHKNIRGASVLNMASQNGYNKVVKYLLDNFDLDINNRANISNYGRKINRTAISSAVVNKNEELVDTFLKHKKKDTISNNTLGILLQLETTDNIEKKIQKEITNRRKQSLKKSVSRMTKGVAVNEITDNIFKFTSNNPNSNTYGGK